MKNKTVCLDCGRLLSDCTCDVDREIEEGEYNKPPTPEGEKEGE